MLRELSVGLRQSNDDGWNEFWRPDVVDDIKAGNQGLQLLCSGEGVCNRENRARLSTAVVALE